MSMTSRLHTLLLLSTTLAFSGCQMSQPAARQPVPVAKQPPAVERVPAPAPAAGAAGQPNLALSGARGEPGATVTVTTTLSTGGASIAGTQNDIVFDPKQVVIAQTAAGKPDCRPNQQIRKEGTAFNFLPPGCHGDACTSVRALVLSLSNVEPIPNGSALYSCRVQVMKGARQGIARLTMTHVGFSNPTGQSIAGGGADGTVNIEPAGR